MNIQPTPIHGLQIIEPAVFQDSRGYFFESFNSAKAEAAGLNFNFVQDNLSKSKRGTVRGLHFQHGEMAQTKLVSVAHGCVLDVAVDLRSKSATFGQSFTIELSDQNFKQLLIPRGFAHGFVCLSETAIFSYKCDNFYSKAHDGGIRFDDPVLNINWAILKDEMIVSDKDLSLPFFTDIKDSLCF